MLDKIRIQFYSHAKCRGCQIYVPIHHYISNEFVTYRQQSFGQTVLYRKCQKCRAASSSSNQVEIKLEDADPMTDLSDDGEDSVCSECSRLGSIIHMHITQYALPDRTHDEEMVHKYCHGLVVPYHLPERARLKKSPPTDLQYETIVVFNKSKCFGCQHYRPITDFLKTREVIYQNMVYPHPRIFRTCDGCRQESRNEYICNPLRRIMEPIEGKDDESDEWEEEEDS